MLGAFVDQPPGVGVAGLRQTSHAALAAAARLAGHQPGIRHELPRMGKTVDVAQLGDEDHGGDNADAAQAHQGAHDGCLRPRCEHILHLLLEPGDALVGGFDGLDRFLQNDAHGRQCQGDAAQGAHAGFAPRRFAGDAMAVTQEEGFELAHGAALVIDGIGAGPAEIPDTFIHDIGHMHGGEFTGTVEAGEHEGVAPVRFDPVAFCLWDQRRGGDHAGNALFGEMPGDHKSGRAGFITDAQFFAGMPQFGEDGIQRAQVAGDFSVSAHFAFAGGVGSGDADGVGVDIESDIEYGPDH